MVRRHRIGLRPHMLVMSAGLESTDIDTEEDFEIAEVVARRMQRTSTKSSTRN
jgi:CMP-N-acetylneuraminic acid synthetase|eukprot:COSAG01_NODE_5764_length_4047_cov_3.196302_2_plen_53_part_00